MRLCKFFQEVRTFVAGMEEFVDKRERSESTVEPACFCDFDEESVSRKLTCSDGAATLKDYMKYIGFDVDTDEDYLWIANAFMDEELPPNCESKLNLEGTYSWNVLKEHGID